MYIGVETRPFSWGISFGVQPTYTIARLISEIRRSESSDSEDMSIDDNDFVRHLESLENTCMLLFKGEDLMEHPSRTLKELGIKSRDKLIIRDKRPFSINISMHRRKSVEIEIEVHDTIPILKERIQTIVGIPAEKQRLCYVDLDSQIHQVIFDDSVPLEDYGIMKKWRDSRASQHQIWLYTDDEPILDAGQCSPINLVGSSSSRMEIIVQFYDENHYVQFLGMDVESYYTVNQLLMMMTQEANYFEEISMLIFHCKNLLEHGSSTLCDLGIHDQDKLLVPMKGRFTIMVTFTSSLDKQKQSYIDVEDNWNVHNLKEKIKTITNIPLKKQRLCFVQNGPLDEDGDLVMTGEECQECHQVLTDDLRNLAHYGIMKQGYGICCIGVSTVEDNLTGEDGGHS